MTPTEQKVLACLYPNNPLAPAWRGSKTAFDIATETGLSVPTVRRALVALYRQDRACAFAPHKWDRADGKTAACRVWLAGTEDPGFPNPRY